MSCQHLIIWNGACGVCGTRVNSLNTHTVVADYPQIQITKQEAARLDMQKGEQLLKNRKLSLVLDLDNTLVHAAFQPYYSKLIEKEPNLGVHSFTLFRSRHFLKLRFDIFFFSLFFIHL
jgi:RNA polymerase II subunit A-like phosphatase